MRYAAALVGIAVTALAGFTLGQPPVAPAAQPAPAAPPAPEYYPLNSRTIKLPIKYEKDRKTIRQVLLYVARNGENTWYQEAAVPPDRDAFTYVAREDGVYWFTMVIEDLQGRKDPADLTRTVPDLKVLVDTLPPRVQFTNARRNGEEVIVEWFVDDKHPDDNATKVHFRAAGSEGYWQEVTLPAGSKSGVRFPAGTTGPVSVRVTAYDLAGNKTEAVREVGTTAANTQTSMSPPTAVPPVTPVSPSGGVGTGSIPPPDSLVPPSPVGPIGPPASPPATAVPPAGGGSTPIAPVGPGVGSPPVSPLPITDPRLPATAGTGGPAPVAVWSGAPGAAAPTVEVTRAQVINYLAFDVGYEIESRGPSGIGRVDLWVTRDDGRTWLKWSQHDGKASSLRVNLNVPANPQPEGAYGFRVVPVSGAGLSEREPVAGDAPELRVVVDVTPPQLDLFPPVGDPASPDTLVIQWKATDRNFADDPITIEWSDKPTGSWQPVASAADGLPGGTAPQARRLPNTGQYAWRVPAGLPPRVYLRVTARDAAGNVREVVTRDPILIDLVKPRAKISGIVGPAGTPRP
jgi:hypothetical protein